MNNVNVDVLVNGSSVAQYHSGGKIYIQANEGSEYEIKIQNSNPYRVLVVSSVDGLNTLNGNPAGVLDAGYIIGAYDSYKIKGFRYSDDAVGAFKFSKKENSYSATKGKKSEWNCGVIGICIYKEKETNYYHCPPLKKYPIGRNTPEDSIPWICPPTPYPTVTWSIYNINTDGTTYDSIPHNNMLQCCNNTSTYTWSIKEPTVTEKSFDMGSSWGSKKESKVVESEFERGEAILSQEIYYASRKSLINMGVISDSKPKVAFPKSFPKKYATPPKGWNG